MILPLPGILGLMSLFTTGVDEDDVTMNLNFDVPWSPAYSDPSSAEYEEMATQARLMVIICIYTY